MPGRSLVARPLHPEPRREHLVGGRTGAPDRAGVRRVAEQRAERHDRSRSRSCAATRDARRRRTCASAGSARRRAAARGRDRRRAATRPRTSSDGQFDRAHDAVDELDRRPRGLEVEVLLGVERRERRARRRARQPAHRVGRGVGRRRSSPRTRRPAPAARNVRFARSTGRSRSHPMPVRAASTTGLRSVPTPSIVISTTSPSTSQRGGVRAAPTPAGVPVRITSPGFERAALADPRDQVRDSRTRARTCSTTAATSPFTRVSIASPPARSISSSETTSGPSGQNVSNDFDQLHWPVVY